MPQATVTIPVDEELARAYQAASVEEQIKIQLLLQLRSRELTQQRDTARRELQQLMREISEEAQRRGMTPEILQDILDDDE